MVYQDLAPCHEHQVDVLISFGQRGIPIGVEKMICLSHFGSTVCRVVIQMLLVQFRGSASKSFPAMHVED